MNQQKFDDRLIRILEKEVLKEKWKKKARIAGLVISKRISKKGSFVFKVQTKKSEYEVIVPEHRKKEFEISSNIHEGDIMKAIGDKQASGIIFCERIKKMGKSNLNENQMKLLD